MFQVVILLSLVIISSAKILDASDLLDFNDVQDIKSDVHSLLDYNVDVQDIVSDVPIWVLKLHSDWKMELKPARPDEEVEFKENTKYAIANYERTVALKEVSPKPQVSEDEGINVEKEDIFKILNKFVMYASKKPDTQTYSSEEKEDETHIVLYFKGPYTLLEVNVGNEQWNYFIRPPSSFPSWFYKEHKLNSGETSARVPDDVTKRFNVALVRLLITMLKYPLYF